MYVMQSVHGYVLILFYFGYFDYFLYFTIKNNLEFNDSQPWQCISPRLTL